ncbi:MAG: HIT domain-containing protein [Candidatus Dormibacteraeota bacterium]|nr:HIT domain-containing protein [Candidatus Dormibacteraeota bacterium]
MKQLWAPWRMVYVGGDAPEGCFLCDAIAGTDHEASLVVARAPLTITLLNRFPYSSGHVMVVPTRHVHDPRELAPEEGAALFAGAQCALAAIDAALHPDGFNMGLNLGSAAGSSVEHMHLHVVPRWAGDTNFMPVLGDVKVLPEVLETTATKLRDAFSTL